MQSPGFFYVDMQGKGKCPLPLHSIPKTNNNTKTKTNNKTKTKNKIKVVYTEDLTHPGGCKRDCVNDHRKRRMGTDGHRQGTH
jgi:hypothetical protein